MLAQVLWTATALRFEGERFFAALFEHGWTFVHGAYGSPRAGADPSEAVAEFLGLLDATRAASERLERAEIGETVELPLDVKTLVQHVRDSESWMRDGPFDRLTAAEKVDVLECRAAARALLDEFALCAC